MAPRDAHPLRALFLELHDCFDASLNLPALDAVFQESADLRAAGVDLSGGDLGKSAVALRTIFFFRQTAVGSQRRMGIRVSQEGDQPFPECGGRGGEG